MTSKALDNTVRTLDCTDSADRRAAAKELYLRSQHVDESGRETLLELHPYLDDDDPVVRAHIGAVVGEAGFDQQTFDDYDPIPHFEALLELFTDEDDRVRQTALGVFWNRPYTPLWDDPELYDDLEQVRELAAVGFAFCLDDETDLIRKRAAQMFPVSLLTDHPTLEAHVVSVLIRRLDDDFEVVRTAASEAITHLLEHVPAVVRPHRDVLLAHLEQRDDDDTVAELRALVSVDPDE
ncbi:MULTISPECIES: HEAT repeat domain-containing protein [unclassified Natrinema]|uniref:HEAT repeat domain-containing protein n=1 Tax=unclassified Natrinema TaxID=2622230 RepID=UPI00026D455A|nr:MULTISPECIES: hypothetical protein [unclassified Natrinema]AFO57627.1 hypothetical protein NJ7G_2394 [Natrinema sp. J7-2]